MPVNTIQATATHRTHELLRDARALLAANDAALVRSQVALSEIPSPTGMEGERARYVAFRLRDAGLDIETDSVGNVIAQLGERTETAPVVVCAHLDTVFAAADDVTVTTDGSRLIGRGIGDNARGLAAMIALAEAMQRTGLRTRRPIVWLATVGEEALGDLRGAKHYFATDPGRHAHAALIVDGPGDERVVHRAVGSRRWRIMFTGSGGHSWSAYGLPNPLNAAGCVAAMVAALDIPAEPASGGAAVLSPGINLAIASAADPQRRNPRSARFTQESGSSEILQSNRRTLTPCQRPIRNQMKSAATAATLATATVIKNEKWP